MNLQTLTVKELKALATEKGITVTGDKRKKETWLNALTQVKATTIAPTPVVNSRIAALEKAFALPRLALNFGQLKQLATAKGVKITGDKRKQQSYVTALKLALG